LGHEWDLAQIGGVVGAAAVAIAVAPGAEPT
jgi:hypothetical protein